MKKMFWFVALLGVLFLNPIDADAASISSSWKRWCSSSCEQTYTFTINNSDKSSLTELKPTLILTGDASDIEVISIEGAEGWIATTSREDNKIIMTFTRTDATQETSFTLGTLKLRLKDYNTDHSAQLELNGVTKDVDKATKTLTSNGEVSENPETGASINYLIVGSCLLLSIVVFTLSKKNKKIYKI